VFILLSVSHFLEDMSYAIVHVNFDLLWLDLLPWRHWQISALWQLQLCDSKSGFFRVTCLKQVCRPLVLVPRVAESQSFRRLFNYLYRGLLFGRTLSIWQWSIGSSCVGVCWNLSQWRDHVWQTSGAQNLNNTLFEWQFLQNIFSCAAEYFPHYWHLKPVTQWL